MLITNNLFSQQQFHGLVLKYDTVQTIPIFQAAILVNVGNQSTINLRSLPDGSYKFDLKKSLKYSVKISYASGDYADTIFTFTTDKNDKPSAQNVIVRLKKNGIWLSGTVRSQAEFFPIADATVIMKNVMTRQEMRYTTGKDGAYRFRLDYDMNYRVTLDKRSDGIFNKYRDTVFYISTIGISQPLDYSMNILLDEDRVKDTEPIEGYDPTKPANNEIKPAVDVLSKRYKKAIALPLEDEAQFVPPSPAPPTPPKGESQAQTPPTPLKGESSPQPVSPVAVQDIPPVDPKIIPQPTADTTPSTAQMKQSVAPPVAPKPVPQPVVNTGTNPTALNSSGETAGSSKPVKSKSELKGELKQAQKDLADLKKKEADAAKRARRYAEIQRKLKEKNKGVEIVIIGDDTQSNLVKITQQRQDAEKSVKELEEEMAQVKKR